MLMRAHQVLLQAATIAGRNATRMPGFLALVCVFMGVFILAGIGWALLSIVPLLLAIDRRL